MYERPKDKLFESSLVRCRPTASTLPKKRDGVGDSGGVKMFGFLIEFVGKNLGR